MGTTTHPSGTTGLAWSDLRELRARAEAGPGRRDRYELLDGELLVSPSPTLRYQLAVVALVAALHQWGRSHGFVTLVAPMDVWFSDVTILQPDVLVLPSDDELGTSERVTTVPVLVLEVSSPSTRRQDLVRKRRVYERAGVPEFWFVDLDADQVHVYRPGDDDTYGPPEVVLAGGTVRSSVLDGFTIECDDALAVEGG